MSEGFDVDLPVLRENAAAMGNDAGTIDTAAGNASDALDSVGAAAGDGPLAGAADALSAQMSSALGFVRRNVDATGAALNAAAGNYQSSDAAASRRLHIPGF